MSIINLIGNDCMEIIEGFKLDLDNYQKQLDDITKCSYSDEFQGKYENNPIILSDFKEHFLKHNLSNCIKYQMKCYDDSRDSSFYILNLNDDEVFEKTEIINMVKIEDSDTIYLEFAAYKFENFENNTEIEIHEDNSYLIEDSDTESEIDFLMTLA